MTITTIDLNTSTPQKETQDGGTRGTDLEQRHLRAEAGAAAATLPGPVQGQKVEIRGTENQLCDCQNCPTMKRTVFRGSEHPNHW